MDSHALAAGIGTIIAAAALLGSPPGAYSAAKCSAAAKPAACLAGARGSVARAATRSGAKQKAPASAGRGSRTKLQSGGPASAGAAKTAPGGSGYLPGGSTRAVFPTAVHPKYSDRPPGRARRQTCLDQYRLNKASGANGGLSWVQKDGGYYSECDRRLKAVEKR